MKYFTQLNILTRFNVIIGSFLLIVFFVSSVVLLQMQKKNDFLMAGQQMNANINELYDYYDVLIKQNQTGLSASINYANHLFSMMGQVVERDSVKIEMDAVNLLTNTHKKVMVNQWFLNDTLIQQNPYLLDKFNILASANASIYQKIPEGYLCVTTNIIEENGRRATGFYIPNSSPVVEIVERGQMYQGRAFLNNQWQLTAYQPIFIGNQVKGMLFLGVKEVNNQTIEQLFSAKKYFSSGYAFLLDRNGQYLYHPSLKGQSISQTRFFEQFSVSANRTRNFRYFQVDREEADPGQNNRFSETKEYLDFNLRDFVSLPGWTSKWKHVHYRYHKATDTFIVGVIDESQLIDKLMFYRRALYLTIFLSILILLGAVTILIRPFMNALNAIKVTIAKVSKGEIPEPVTVIKEDEIGEIAGSLNKIIDMSGNITVFSAEIGRGNFDYQYKMLSETDAVGKSLITMQANLMRIREVQETRENEDNRQKWIATGYSTMSDILRRYNDNLSKLSFEIINYLVRYLDANQGGVFLLNDSDGNNLYFEQVATYAFDKKRLITKQIPYNNGLLGRCYAEKKTLFFSDVPEAYAEISSGLGGSAPNYLIIVPLTNNDKVLGIIEIASFKILNATHVEFIERASRTIASTIATVKTNNQTSQLLEQTKIQALTLSAKEEEMRKNLDELNQIQEEMARQNIEMQGLSNAVDNSIISAVYALDGNFVTVNRNLLAITGFSADEIISKNIVDFVLDEEKDSFRELWNEIIAGHVFNGEILRKAKSGALIWQLASYTPVRNRNGEFYRVYFLGQDITRLKTKEKEAIEISEKIKVRNEELEMKVSDLEIKNIALNQKLSENTAKAKFINTLEKTK
jgi:PAS domain S-box-containing protein